MSTPTAAAPMSFTLFSLLPPEIRLKIWSQALKDQTPRTINYGEAHELRPKSRYCIHIPKFQSHVITTPVPALLHACSESRHEALKVNKRMVGRASNVFFNPYVDTMFFEYVDDLSRLLWEIEDFEEENERDVGYMEVADLRSIRIDMGRLVLHKGDLDILNELAGSLKKVVFTDLMERELKWIMDLWGDFWKDVLEKEHWPEVVYNVKPRYGFGIWDI